MGNLDSSITSDVYVLGAALPDYDSASGRLAARSPTGTLFVAKENATWSSITYLYSKNDGKTWSQISTGFGTPPTPPPYYQVQAVAADASEIAYVVFQKYDNLDDQYGAQQIYITSYTSGVTMNTQMVSDVGVYQGRAACALDPINNILHIVWSNVVDGARFLCYRHVHTSTNEWSPILTLQAGLSPSIAVSPLDNSIWIAWKQESGGMCNLMYCQNFMFADDDSFTASPPYTLNESNTLAQFNGRCSIGVDSIGHPHVVWDGRNMVEQNFNVYYSSYDGCVWSDPITLNQEYYSLGHNSSAPTLTIDQHNNINVLWRYAASSGVYIQGRALSVYGISDITSISSTNEVGSSVRSTTRFAEFPNTAWAVNAIPYYGYAFTYLLYDTSQDSYTLYYETVNLIWTYSAYRPVFRGS